ncbi:Galectin-3 [Crepidotus variabilis]|uniref:Galectin n=1 Tax=Crepidotus variabilis TaxID=179855 RepID=A0A9P6EAD2_9AGAR|nr:Galectin-3 [Crepidotus variabilis]
MATPSQHFHQVRLNQTATLPEPVKVDGIIIFRSSEVNMNNLQNGESDNTSLNLLNANEDNMLHISIRRLQNAIVFTTMSNGGGWGPEERVELKGRFDGPNSTIAIFNHPDMYQIIANGRTIHYFKKRIQGDVVKIRYGTNTGQPSVFSDPIAVETYKDWAALVPGSRSVL